MRKFIFEVPSEDLAGGTNNVSYWQNSDGTYGAIAFNFLGEVMERYKADNLVQLEYQIETDVYICPFCGNLSYLCYSSSDMRCGDCNDEDE